MGILALAAVSAADLKYTVGNGSDDLKLLITLEYKADGETTSIQIPNWAPGSYRYANNPARVTDVKATVDGSTIEVTKSEAGTLPKIVTWTVPTTRGQKVAWTYSIPVQFANGIGHYAGPSTYIYPVGRTQERCALEFAFKTPTPIAVGLDRVRDDNHYKADTYDVLADNPVTYGNFVADTYKVDGKVHTIAYRGPATAIGEVDREYVIKACKFITEMQGDFFGGLPYNKYIWHFAVNSGGDGAGGLEHLSSTQISMASGVGPGVVSVYSHEFFHLWNVKRIRSYVLGPFDYTTLPQTGALWWLEGVTDYYGHTLLGRYGWFGKNERSKDPISKMWDDLVDNVNQVRARQDRFNVSPHDSSYRVRDASNGQGNSQGYLVSYYPTGWLCGFVLDVEILSKTNGKFSLDDVEKALWRKNKNNQPGFQEDEIRKQVINYGGNTLGEFYDTVIMKPGELPVEAQLGKLGYEMKEVEETIAKAPFVASATTADGMKVASSDLEGLKLGDVVKSINNVTFSGSGQRMNADLRNLTRNSKPGDVWTVTIVREGVTSEVKVTMGTGTQKSRRIVSLPNATADQLRLRKIFEAKRR